MKSLWAVAMIALFTGCGPQYTIPNYDTGEVEKVISSGRSPQACIDNLKEDAQKLNVKVRLTDVHHEATSGPIAWLYANSYICTGKVIATKS
jgi:hypothetical protein